MKVALYVCRDKGGWKMLLSLDIRVDVTWWLEGASGQQVLSLMLLDEELPLSQASWLVEHFEIERGMEQWNGGHWQTYRKRRVEEYDKLSGEQVARREGGGLAKGAEFAVKRELGASGMPAAYPAEAWAQLEQGAALLAERLRGRQLLAAEAEGLLADTVPQLASWRAAAQLARLQGRLSITAALALATRRRPAWLSAHGAPRCRRCGSVAGQRVPCAACGLAACAYCEACLALGRSRACALLLRSAAPAAVQGTATAPTGGGLARWGLSAAQSAAASAALAYLARPASAGDGPGRFLLWAVTGAGKTEMIFPLLQHTLERGGRALVATPRRDVVLELAPRLAKAFPDVTLATLYGGSTERWKDAQLTLATTHQLMRFYQGFDLVIIDELDAFPYNINSK